MKRMLLLLGLTSMLAAAATPASGQAPNASPSGHAHGQGKGPDRDDKEKDKDEGKGKKDDKDDRGGPGRSDGARSPADDPDIKDLKEEWKKKHAEWVDKRKERRDAAKAAAKTELGAKVSLLPVRAELERHARRVARLERIIFLADANEKTTLAQKARDLLKQENERHVRRIAALKTEAK